MNEQVGLFESGEAEDSLARQEQDVLLERDETIEAIEAAGESALLSQETIAEDAVQLAFLDLQEPWRAEWQNMPEFSQADMTPAKTLYVHFESREDLQAFQVLLGQRIHWTTPYIWYPEKQWNRVTYKRYVDEESASTS